MPFTLEEDGEFLRVRLQGHVPGKELHEVLTAMETLVRGRARWPDNLVDLRGIDLSDLDFADVRSLAKRRQALKPPHPFRTAMVADGPLVMGFARMFQTVNDNPAITLEIFRSIETAEAWLTGR